MTHLLIFAAKAAGSQDHPPRSDRKVWKDPRGGALRWRSHGSSVGSASGHTGMHLPASSLSLLYAPTSKGLSMRASFSVLPCSSSEKLRTASQSVSQGDTLVSL